MQATCPNLTEGHESQNTAHLFLEEVGSEHDLVLLEPARLAGPLGGVVVPLAPRPVLLVLGVLWYRLRLGKVVRRDQTNRPRFGRVV